MLENVYLEKRITKKEYRTGILPLKKRLSALQHKIKESNIPVIVIFEGWDVSGKSTLMADVIQALDPRNFEVKVVHPPEKETRCWPFLRRHWTHLPPRGILGLYEGSWYSEVVEDCMADKKQLRAVGRKMESIYMFERQLSDAGALIIRFFLHISKKEQKRRLDFLSSDKNTAWLVSKENYRRNKQYPHRRSVYEETLNAPGHPNGPWHIIPSHDKRTALAEIYPILVSSIESALAKPGSPRVPELSPGPYSLVKTPLLSDVSLNKSIGQREYKQELKRLQKHLMRLHNEIHIKKIPVVIAYEGWDAAGKGGNIKRLTAALDPRRYEVVPIAEPTPTDLQHPYLWRFWMTLQKNMHITIYDRSWYGRVLVERVEGIAKEEEWKNAYREINEFEQELDNWGAVLLKFWLQIDKEEQLRRFESRQKVTEKQWKITDADWRNREAWDRYEVAVNDMLRLTSTSFAPWTIIESHDKRFARIKTLKATIEAIEARL